jgi:ketosteroid isomerase-like protein
MGGTTGRGSAMAALSPLTDEVMKFHEHLCRDWEHADGALVEPGMVLYVPEGFPWQPVTFRGIEAFRNYRDALHVLSDGTFETAVIGHTADESLVAIRCHETATRNRAKREWSSLWAYILDDGLITEARVFHAVASDDFADFWCT